MSNILFFMEDKFVFTKDTCRLQLKIDELFVVSRLIGYQIKRMEFELPNTSNVRNYTIRYDFTNTINTHKVSFSYDQGKLSDIYFLYDEKEYYSINSNNIELIELEVNNLIRNIL